MFVQQLAQHLDYQKIPYAIVGGFAVALHGAVRGTVDIDLVIQFEQESFIKIEKALLKLGLEPRLPVRGADVFQFRVEYITHRNLIAWNFYNPKKPSEQVDIILTQNLKEIKIVKIPIGAIELKVASIPDLIKMKNLSGRPQDLADIAALKQLLTFRDSK